MPLVRAVFVLGAILLAVLAISRDVDGFRGAVASVGGARAVTAFLLVIGGLVASGEVWRLAVAAVAGRLGHAEARHVFFVSQLGKYVPGAVWTIAAQVEMARRHGLSRAAMGLGALLFLGYHLVSGMVVAAAILPIGNPDLVVRYPWVLALTTIAVVSVLPPVLSWIIDRSLHLLRQPPLRRKLRATDVLPPLAWMLVVWACFGLATYVVSEPLRLGATSMPTLVLASIGGFAIAWVVGVLVLPAPAGVGPREVAFVVVLAPLLGLTAATSVAVLLRVVHTAADLALAGAVRLIERGDRPTPGPRSG
jgi:glycosyltransferase 2 family protein